MPKHYKIKNNRSCYMKYIIKKKKKNKIITLNYIFFKFNNNYKLLILFASLTRIETETTFLFAFFAFLDLFIKATLLLINLRSL